MTFRAPHLAAALLVLAGCATVRDVLAPAPVGKPSGRDGWLVYQVASLRFEAPATWHASGGERRIALESPDGRARLEVSYPETPFPDERTCLAAADEKLREQAAQLERARRHATRFGGVAAQTLEADERGWHVWAYAACDGGVQYRVFFTAATPAAADPLEAQRTLVATARIGGES
ncbi:MAG TPA: hypothetical protein VF841_04635 [Anaeromyxobacter sp.]